jgi:hypothetical protein
MKTLLAYPLIGLLLGFAEPLLKQVGGATSVSVYVLLPLAAVALAIAQPRLWSVWLGAILMTLGFGAGLMVQYHGERPWSAGDLLCAVPPVLLAAGVVYGALGTVVALLRRAGLLGKSG